MTGKDLFIEIQAWKEIVGENFIEYFVDNCKNVRVPKMVLWLYKEKYMTKTQLDNYCEELFKAKEFYQEPNGLKIFLGNYSYSILTSLSDDNREYKSEQILADYLSLNQIGVDFLYKFIYEGKGWSSMTKKKEIENHKKIVESMIDSYNKNEELFFKYEELK